MPVPTLITDGVSFRADLSYSDLELKLSNDDIMIKDYLGIGEQSAFIIGQLNLNVEQINKNEEDIAENKAAIGDLTDIVDENFDYLNGKERQPEYDESTNYTTLYQVVSYLGQSYALTSAPTTGPFDPLAWQLLGVSVTGSRLELLIDIALDSFQFTAYGGLFLDSAPFAFPDITATYQTLDCFDAISFATPRNVVQNLANSSLLFTDLGVYEVSLSLTVKHNDSGSDREFFIRTYNLTDGVALTTSLPVFVSKNQGGTNYSCNFPIEFSDVSGLNKEVILQIGGGDTLSSVSFETAEYYIKSIGEYRTAFPQTN